MGDNLLKEHVVSLCSGKYKNKRYFISQDPSSVPKRTTSVRCSAWESFELLRMISSQRGRRYFDKKYLGWYPCNPRKEEGDTSTRNTSYLTNPLGDQKIQTANCWTAWMINDVNSWPLWSADWNYTFVQHRMYEIRSMMITMSDGW